MKIKSILITIGVILGTFAVAYAAYEIAKVLAIVVGFLAVYGAVRLFFDIRGLFKPKVKATTA